VKAGSNSPTDAGTVGRAKVDEWVAIA